MDKLARGIQSQTVALSTSDMSPSFINIPYYFHYGNHANDPRFMPTELLRESFYLTLLDFPLFVGRLEADGSGHAWIVVDKDNLNIPEFLESQSSVHFDDIQAAKFSWDALPEAVATVSAITTAGTGGVIKPANIHVVRLRDNSGIVLHIGVAHYLVDGAAYSEFVGRWADVCRRLSSGASSAELPSFQASFSRSTISDHLPDDRRALDNPTRELITTTGLFARWLAWISPKTRSTILGAALSRRGLEGHAFHISASKLASLRASIQEYITTSERISGNDVITALLSMAVAQSEAECKQDAAATRGYLSSLASYLFPSMYAQNSEFATQITLDIRPRLKGLSAARYIGNAVVTRCLASPMESLTSGIDAQSLALAAQNVRKLVNDVDPQYIGQYIDTLHKDPSCFMCPIACALSKTMMVVSNQSRFSLYKADFGSGTPVWVSPPRTFFTNFISILPAPPSADGYVLCVSMTTQAMAKLLNNKFWSNIVDLLF
ncbi:hypothetical protein GGF42_002189 [Coemansia sp. RSA 2424]|nr:hypothetical protein GGF42_002189 [Coemansia sp. RSA 2424]